MNKKLFTLEFTRTTEKFLQKAEKKNKEKILHKLKLLADGCNTLDIKALIGIDNVYRLRVGDYRVIYTQHFDILIKIGHRKDVYR